TVQLPKDLLAETGKALRPHSRGLQALEREIQRNAALQTTGVTLLLAADEAWRPSSQLTMLPTVRAAGAKWPKVNLETCNLILANFVGADLSNACLRQAIATRANFRKAILREA